MADIGTPSAYTLGDLFKVLAPLKDHSHDDDICDFVQSRGGYSELELGALPSDEALDLLATVGKLIPEDSLDIKRELIRRMVIAVWLKLRATVGEGAIDINYDTGAMRYNQP